MKKVYIIAEAGVNHNGSLDIAKKMICVAAKAGVDAIKFQTFKAENLVSKTAPKAQYQMQMTDVHESQYEMLKKLEIDITAHLELMKCCEENHIEFLSTPFDSDSLALLVNDCKLPRIKIPSGEITNAPFLLQIAQTGKPVILSTGMSTLSEIEIALSTLAFGYLNRKDVPSLDGFLSVYASYEGQEVLQEKVTLLHCTTEYPAPFNEVNLKCMDTMNQVFDLPVGYSDHTEGICIPIAAVARGAVMIEKHFTLDRTLMGPDHKASLEPQELKEMVQGIRQIEKAIGNGIKAPSVSEMKNKVIVRKSLIAKAPIYKGEIFTADNLTVKRPGDGISPIYYWSKIGEKAKSDYEEDEVIRE
ncbi:N,N'-diacetyllegionaminic acid synthase [bioreactor metagenome]|uniref:N,N'-diacetyllegionaminic acid synthase n=1 Tax=bioreactor metagenome TaxID=1076179 RepID=A0A644TPH2_9ZZZZ